MAILSQTQAGPRHKHKIRLDRSFLDVHWSFVLFWRIEQNISEWWSVCLLITHHPHLETLTKSTLIKCLTLFAVGQKSPTDWIFYKITQIQLFEKPCFGQTSPHYWHYQLHLSIHKCCLHDFVRNCLKFVCIHFKVFIRKIFLCWWFYSYVFQRVILVFKWIIFGW